MNNTTASQDFFFFFANNRSRLVAPCSGTWGLASGPVRYRRAAWGLLEQCPEHPFPQDPPKLVQGQRNNHKARVQPLPPWGFPNILSTPVFRAQMGAPSQQVGSGGGSGPSRILFGPCYPKTRTTEHQVLLQKPFCYLGMGGPCPFAASVGAACVVEEFPPFSHRHCWRQTRNCQKRCQFPSESSPVPWPFSLCAFHK